MSNETNKTQTKIKTAQATGRKLKVTLILTEVNIQLDTAGCAVQLDILIDGQKVIAPVNPKSFRKVQTSLKAAIEEGQRDSLIVLLSGELDLGAKRILNAGIVAQPRTPAQSETPPLPAPAQTAPNPNVRTQATEQISELEPKKTQEPPVVVYKKVRQAVLPD